MNEGGMRLLSHVCSAQPSRNKSRQLEKVVFLVGSYVITSGLQLTHTRELECFMAAWTRRYFTSRYFQYFREDREDRSRW